MKVRVATCYFPVSADILQNNDYVSKQLRVASRQGADVAHFPEACLSGYAGSDFTSYRGFDWQLLESCTRQVLDAARDLGIWVILGSTHRLTGRHKPHDSVYVISSRGRIIDRYDKRFCSNEDLVHYSPGNHLSVFHVNGVRCGVLICYEYAFPELYREYKRHRVQLIFHSYHAGHASPAWVERLRRQIGPAVIKLNRGGSFPEIRMPTSMQAAAGDNHMWISCSNTSAKHSCFPSFFVRADGLVSGRLRRHVPGVLITTVDTRERLYDGTAAWRDRAMRGVFHSGAVTRDRRSEQRTRL
jgi:predicted amidohydrolase